MKKTTPIKRNPDVQELLALMEANDHPSMGDMLHILEQVTVVQRQLNQAIDDLNAMRKVMEEKNRPLAQKAFIAAQSQVQELRSKIVGLKQHVSNGCKNALSEFWQEGISALDKISRFFKIRPLLEGVRGQAEKCIAAMEKLEACAAQKPSLQETLKRNAQKSQEMFGSPQPQAERKEPVR